MCICLFSCKKKNTHPNLPDIRVDETVWLDNPENINLKMVGGIKLISGGLNGIVIYRLSENTYLAYENTCPHLYNYKSKCARLNKNSSTIIMCPCDKSKFSLIDGSSLSETTEVPLKRYDVTYNPKNRSLSIIN